ncbi:hypothetical protein BCQ_PT63 (plasmid) [Bacillus cereus Q1]|uniref:HTH cro/C1-type domain-containing protein n=2 Tax=Bacillus cereus group TaxID=86661 RepID=B9J6N0_BACCQ|nr:hypothetical protein BCQ_PT63 [Bacillus cereus Q1]
MCFLIKKFIFLAKKFTKYKLFDKINLVIDKRGEIDMRFDNKKLSTLLRNKNMKQKVFAKAIQRAPSTVSLYLSGDVEPGRKALIAMSEVLKVPVDELFVKENSY